MLSVAQTVGIAAAVELTATASGRKQTAAAAPAAECNLEASDMHLVEVLAFGSKLVDRDWPRASAPARAFGIAARVGGLYDPAETATTAAGT